MPYSCCAQQNVCREQAKVRAAANLFFTIETLVKEKKQKYCSTGANLPSTFVYETVPVEIIHF